MLTWEARVNRILPLALHGRVKRMTGLTVSAVGLPAPVGAVCAIERDGAPPVSAEVIGFRDHETLLLATEELDGIRHGNAVRLDRSMRGLRVGPRLLGRVLDGRGRFLDHKPPPPLPHLVPLDGAPAPPLGRPRIRQPLATGVRVIDGLLTCGQGQRMGIFSGSGVGKSVLLGQMARNSSADVNVVILVGERGREVAEFLERDLGPAGLARSVVVVATSNEPALMRLRAVQAGTSIAEYFRDLGRNVLLMMDSVTRCALAQREIGLAAGEPPVTRGYPPSVFSMLPRLLERAGTAATGSITALYTVLVEADDANEPISDAVRGILDGHIMLSRKLAHQAHWPAIDPLASVSRSMRDVVGDDHWRAASTVKQLLAAYQQSEDLIAIGAYQPGSSSAVDAALRLREPMLAFLRQGIDEAATLAEARAALLRLAEQCRQAGKMLS